MQLKPEEMRRPPITSSGFRSEKHAAMGAWDQNILHGLTFVQHAASGFMQVGAFGTSPYSKKGDASMPISSSRDRNAERPPRHHASLFGCNTKSSH
jgi:hypothetical protein